MGTWSLVGVCGRRSCVGVLMMMVVQASASAGMSQGHEWGQGSPTVYPPPNLTLVSLLEDSPINAGNPTFFGWAYSGGGGSTGQPVEMDIHFACGDQGEIKSYLDVPIYYYNQPPIPNGKVLLGMTSSDGEAIAINSSLLGGPYAYSSNWGKTQAALIGTLFHEGAHVHYLQSVKENGEQACYDAVSALAQVQDDTANPCEEAFARAYEAESLCHEANHGAGIEGVGWSCDVQQEMKAHADKARQECEEEAERCAEFEAVAGCSVTRPCGVQAEGCPSDCELEDC